MPYININEASELAEKSIQTIRRMIKAGKIKSKQQKTPQGFNYLVDEESILKFAAKVIKEKPASQKLAATSQPTSQKRKLTTQATSQKSPATSQPTSQKKNTTSQQRPHRPVKNGDGQAVFEREINKFNSTIDKLIEQNERDKANFFKLIETFQDRIVVLENQIKMLEAPEKKWYTFWK